MQRIKYTTTATGGGGGGGTCTLSSVSGYSDIGDVPSPYDVSGACVYTILDADGTGWETAYGSISGTTLTRASYPWETSNGAGGPGYYTPLNLSSGTHTVLISRESYEGHVIMNSYTNAVGVAFSTPNTTSLGTMSQVINGLTNASDASAGGSAAVVIGDPKTEFYLARAYRLTFTGECDDTSAGNFFGVGISVNSETKDRVTAWAPLIGTNTICSVTTPIIENRSPFPDPASGTQVLVDGGAVVYTMYNTAGSSITVFPTVYIEWYL